jgi:dipeptidyl aminopeptidase/acylaminoacyl peptidase
VAVGDHDTDEPDVVVVDLLTGRTTTHPLPTGRSVVPLAWSSDGRALAQLLSTEPTNPYSGSRILGDVGLLDLSDDSTEVLEERTAVAVAFSPDGSELAVERTGVDDRISVVELGSGTRRPVDSDGVLAGPAAWSPDGRLLATTTTRPDIGLPNIDSPGTPTGLAFSDATGDGGADVPAAMRLPLTAPGRVLGWSGPDEVVLLLGDGADELTLSRVPLDGSGTRPLMLLPDLGSYGVGRFQLASGTVDALEVVSPADVDRGPWPLPVRGVLTLVVGLAAWLVARAVLRRWARPADVQAGRVT